MPSTRIAQNTQVSSERAKKGEIALNDIRGCPSKSWTFVIK